MTQPDPLTYGQRAVPLVLERLSALVRRSRALTKPLAAGLQALLDELQGHDVFGTEGQCDPRGDFRNGRWSMTKVEDVTVAADSEAQANVLTVLARMSAQALADEYDAEIYQEALEPLLSRLYDAGAFGVCGEQDPRGNFRQGAWSMTRVQGLEGQS